MLKFLHPLKEILKSSWKSEGNTGLIFTKTMRDKTGELLIASKEKFY
jgi:hypothetical protein